MTKAIKRLDLSNYLSAIYRHYFGIAELVNGMRKILIIDDDDPLRKTVVRVLQKNGFKVLEARNAAEGTKLAQTQLPCLILCDLNLEKSDGSALLARLRKNPITANIPFILMTGQVEQTGRLIGSDLGREHWLAKPFTVADLLAAIQTRLRQDGNPPLQANSTGPVKRTSKASREQLEALSGRLQSVLEKERSRVARVIHDDLTQNLTVLALELSLLNSSLSDPVEKIAPEQCRESVTKLSGLVHELIKSAQKITAELRPKVLDEFGLVAALEWLTQQFQKNHGVRCELCVANQDVIVDADVATEIYRLTQETLTNVAQHANASAVCVSIEETAGNLRLEVTDNGKGITARQISDPKSLGLLALRERIEFLKGEFSIDGGPEKGTTVVARIPVNSRSTD